MSEQAREGAAYGDMKAVGAGQAADNLGFSQCGVRSQTTAMERFRAYGYRQLGVLLIVGADMVCLASEAFRWNWGMGHEPPRERRTCWTGASDWLRSLSCDA